ncbi:MAG: WG repeat-containing protein, partial [Niabella sp.]
GEEMYKFINGFAGVRYRNKWGFINTKGDKITDFEFEKVKPFNEGFAGVKKTRWGFINTKGKLVISEKYADVKSFNGGMALVSTNDKYINFGGEEYVTSGGWVDRRPNDYKYTTKVAGYIDCNGNEFWED